MKESKIKEITELAEKAFMATESYRDRAMQMQNACMTMDFEYRKQQAIMKALAQAEMWEARNKLRAATEKE